MSRQRLEEMETFATVVETESFSAAARRLGVTTSAVSRQVRGLETRLGVRLLNRTTRSLALTEGGRTFYQASKGVLAGVEEAEQAVRGRHGAPVGTLRVSLPADFARLQLAEPLAEFASKYPDLTLDLDTSDRFVDVIGEGFDVAVRIATLGDSSLVARRLGVCRHALCATPEYLEHHGVPLGPEELESHQCISYEYLQGSGWKFGGGREAVVVRPRGRIRTNNGDIMRQLVLANLGIAVVPTFLIGDDLRAGRLRSILADQLDRTTDIYAVYPHRKLLAAKVRAFVDHLAAKCGDTPPWDRDL